MSFNPEFTFLDRDVDEDFGKVEARMYTSGKELVRVDSIIVGFIFEGREVIERGVIVRTPLCVCLRNSCVKYDTFNLLPLEV
eukprot:CAMPEP_0182501366 /NCGR_PEP_ID=MMETSP1321-20130603/11199_1 /TAXON_ID=91990 /ORGANISM="Bolidomonas sp., Strain RCC1657" /LENGTH=81 /DNA_ID=CAMNT_0024706033 /DNA_START=150 /DNA_END=395 /DNA_ORIENTATION=-